MKFNKKQTVKSNPKIQKLLDTELIKVKGGKIDKDNDFCNTTCVACTPGNAISM